MIEPKLALAVDCVGMVMPASACIDAYSCRQPALRRPATARSTYNGFRRCCSKSFRRRTNDPDKLASSTTGSCRNPPSRIISNVDPKDRPASTVTGVGVMTLPIRVACPLSPSATTRKTMSRSVRVPTRRPSSTTVTPPTLRSAMRLTAFPTRVSG